MGASCQPTKVGNAKNRGNDVETAKAVADRCDMLVKKILNMPVGMNWIFRRGQAPINAKNIDLDPYKKSKFKTGVDDLCL